LTKQKPHKRRKKSAGQSHTWKVFVASISSQFGNLPLPVIHIFDYEEVCTRSPFETGEDEIYISLSSRKSLNSSSNASINFWFTPTKLDPTMNYAEQAVFLDRLLSA
jgi:hypothetical protein